MKSNKKKGFKSLAIEKQFSIQKYNAISKPNCMLTDLLIKMWISSTSDI